MDDYVTMSVPEEQFIFRKWTQHIGMHEASAVLKNSHTNIKTNRELQ